MRKKQLRFYVVAFGLLLGLNAHGECPECSQTAAPLLDATKFNLTGDMRSRAEDLGKTDFVSDRSDISFRIRPLLTWQPNRETSVVLQLEAAKAMGQRETSPTTGAAQDTSGAAANGDTAVFFHQAYGSYQPVDWFQFMVGRQVLSYGDELVIGQADWNNISRSFDAVRARFTYALGWTEVFSAKLVDLNVAGPGPGDRDLHGIYSGWNFGKFLTQFDLYALELHDATLATVTTTDAVGARAKSTIEQIDYRAEWTRETHSTSGYQANAELGYKFEGTRMPRVSGEYFYASADYNQLFPTAHKWLGYADVLGRRNLKGFGLRANSQMLDWLNVQADYYSFQRVDTTRSAYKLNGSTPLGTGTASSSEDIGSEADLTLKMKVSKALSFAVGSGMFFSGAYLRDQFGGFNPIFSYAQMEVTF